VKLIPRAYAKAAYAKVMCVETRTTRRMRRRSAKR
jgi:hypothetical protein